MIHNDSLFARHSLDWSWFPKLLITAIKNELNFYSAYFRQRVTEWVDDLSLLYTEGMKVGSRFGLRALDALHIAAALIADCDEFITAEKPTSPFNRVISIAVLTIY